LKFPFLQPPPFDGGGRLNLIPLPLDGGGRLNLIPLPLDGGGRLNLIPLPLVIGEEDSTLFPSPLIGEGAGGGDKVIL